ncbi:M48 family metalloprotease [Streptomyces cylindrosporus]|uniref:M48 family metalloprotease n=1 Tax=Streptomyces cylindrosporus TaxID=2927583 RepID=A0ABS9YG88_9ACTN|nr:M48 family metalloprotease [Streptomyces cylindrosporus]MCI3276210.1 M48 family metalloprotease [Streptomyces cylindrosporus]
MLVLSYLFGALWPVAVGAWLLSGALVFHRPTESAIARHAFRLRYPTAQERARLEPVWREVTSLAGIDGRTYELWLQDSDRFNAIGAAGHIVGITTFALDRLTLPELAAVMAHELGHHIDGHAWSSLLGFWYALPGRIAWRVLVSPVVALSRTSPVVFRVFVVLAVLILGGLVLTTVRFLYGAPLLMPAMPYAIAAVGRRAELNADRQAAALGFAPTLASVLGRLHQQECAEHTESVMRNGGAQAGQRPVHKLLSSHPDYYTRLHHLQPYLQQPPR